jgi:hypothetical protein
VAELLFAIPLHLMAVLVEVIQFFLQLHLQEEEAVEVLHLQLQQLLVVLVEEEVPILLFLMELAQVHEMLVHLVILLLLLLHREMMEDLD